MTRAPLRPVNVSSLEATVERRSNGSIYVRSPRPLGAYALILTDRLEYWATVAPERPFLAQRDSQDTWQSITYGEALRRVLSIGQALADRNLSATTTVAILSGNSIEHALLALACLYTGVPYAPIPPAASLGTGERTHLRQLWENLKPSLVFAADGKMFERPLADVVDGRTEVVTVTPPVVLRATAFSDLEDVSPGLSLARAHQKVTPGTVAKILFTSGSTGPPKGVVTTQQMLCANQEMIRTVLSFLAEEPPIVCDWLPWHHTFGGSHNFGMVLYNGGTLYIDGGKPTHSTIRVTIKNLREIATTVYFNVPRGYQLLVQALRSDADLSRHFFSRVRVLFYAAAGLTERLINELQEAAVEACGEEILIVAGLGATESAPMALSTGRERAGAGHVGLPVPGIELKLTPVGSKLEARLRGPTITPGYWRDPERTAAAFDEEGFYKLGDALAFVDPLDPEKGLYFDGRLDEDFKLASGSWVRVGPLRSKFLETFAGLVEEVFFAGPGRDGIGAMIVPEPGAPRAALQQCLTLFAKNATGTSTRVERALLLEAPISQTRGEQTERVSGYLKATWEHRCALIEELYGGSPRVLIAEFE